MMQNTLHDRNVIAIDAMENDLVMRLQSGILETASPYRLIDGYVEFHDVKWDFSYVYLLGVTGNGHKENVPAVETIHAESGKIRVSAEEF